MTQHRGSAIAFVVSCHFVGGSYRKTSKACYMTQRFTSVSPVCFSISCPWGFDGFILSAGPQASASSHLDSVHLQEAAVATSSMAIHLKAPQLHAKLCQAGFGQTLPCLLKLWVCASGFAE